MIEDRELGLSKRDFAIWTVDDIRELTGAFREILSIPNYPVNFVCTLLESHWRNYRARVP